MTEARDEGPPARGIFSGIDIGVAAGIVVGGKEGIKTPLVIFQGCGPLASSINRSTLHVIFRRVGEPVEDIAHGFPVHQVA